MKRLIFTILSLAMGLTMRAQEPVLEARTDTEKATALYHAGKMAQQNNELDQAFELYQHVLALNPNHVGALFDISILHLFVNNDDSLAISLLNRAIENDPDNYWLYQRKAQIYRYVRNDSAAIETMEEIARVFPKRHDVLYTLQGAYSSSGDYDKSLEVLNRIELLDGMSEDITAQKIDIYQALGDSVNELAEIRKLCEAHPNDPGYQCRMGEFYANHGDYDRARGVYEDVLREDPSWSTALVGMLEINEIVMDSVQYCDYLLQTISDPALNVENYLNVLIRMLETDNVPVDTLVKYSRQIASHPDFSAPMAEYCAWHLDQRGADSTEVQFFLEKALELDPGDERVRQDLLVKAIESNDAERVFQLSKGAVENHAQAPAYYYYLSITAYQLDSLDIAVSAARNGVQMVGQDPKFTSLKAQFYSLLGELYHHQDQDAKAFEAYDSCLIITPDDAMVLNNYAYYLALHKEQLDRAEAMARRSLQLEVERRYIYDTYAWVLFQNKKYDEARQWIDSALVVLDQPYTETETTTLEHAGDIYFKCGDKAKAQEFWQQAKALGGGSATLDEKIRKKKYIEEKKK